MHSLITPDVADQDHRQAWLTLNSPLLPSRYGPENRSSMPARGNAQTGISALAPHVSAGA